MKLTSWDEIRKKRFTKEQIAAQDAWVADKVLEIDLRAVRKFAGKKQREVAKVLHVTQPRLSDIENGADHRLSTLRRYVEALGGKLVVSAEFDEKSIKLHVFAS